MEAGRDLPRPPSLLGEGLRRQLRHGRRLRPRDGLSVRHELELFLDLRRPRRRPAARLRSAQRLLSRSGLSRRHAVRLEQGRAGPAFFCNADGRGGHARFGDLDSCLEQLDANAAGHRDHRRARCARRLDQGHLQSILPLPLGAYDGCRLSCHRALRRRVGRLAPLEAARHASGAHHAVDGDVDGAHRCADPDPDRRSAWSQHASLSAGQDRRHGRPLAEQARRERAADPLRLARYGGRDDALCARNPARSAA